jgi:hypothetical protein
MSMHSAMRGNLDVTFTIEFMRLRESDNAHATLDGVTNVGANLDEVKSGPRISSPH